MYKRPTVDGLALQLVLGNNTLFLRPDSELIIFSLVLEKTRLDRPLLLQSVLDPTFTLKKGVVD